MPRPAAEPLSLALCPSAPHRAVLGLFRLSLGEPAYEGLADDLRASAPEEIAAIANNKIAHTFLADGLRANPEIAALLPQDLVIYFEAMRQDCIDQNQRLTEVLGQIGAAFQEAGIKGVVLKGGAELLAPLGPVPCTRPLSDLDILVGDEQMADSIRVLQTLGARSTAEADEVTFSFLSLDASHHAAPLELPDLDTEIELHRRLGNDALIQALLPADLIWHEAVGHSCGLFLPPPPLRLTHMILHAQLGHHLFERRKFKLRDVRDFRLMSDAIGMEDVRKVAGTCHHAGAGEIFDGFAALSGAVLGLSQEQYGDTIAGHRWAKAALMRFAPPQPMTFQRALLAARLIGVWFLTCCWRALTSSEHRRYYLQLLRGSVADRGVFARLRKHLSRNV